MFSQDIPRLDLKVNTLRSQVDQLYVTINLIQTELQILRSNIDNLYKTKESIILKGNSHGN